MNETARQLNVLDHVSGEPKIRAMRDRALAIACGCLMAWCMALAALNVERGLYGWGIVMAMSSLTAAVGCQYWYRRSRR